MGARKHGEIVRALKADYGLGHGYANLVAHHAAGDVKPAGAGSEDLVDSQFAGPKAALRPIYDALIREVSRFGPDVEVAPKKTYVSLRRSKQFGLIQPTTKTRVDVGLNLKGTPPAGRLEASGSFNAMVSHRVRVEAAQEVDEALIGWLKQAYDQA
jgi:predicted transport protein